jgi:hypothetical protein
MVNLRCKGSYIVGNKQVLANTKGLIKRLNNKIIKKGPKEFGPG